MANLKIQPYANWDSFIISENNAAYQQASAPIQKAKTVSFFLLMIVLVLSIGILTLILLMWTRERMTEIGILISLGFSPRQLSLQMLLENYMVALPSFVAATVVSLLLSRGLGTWLGGMLADVPLVPHPAQAAIVLACSAAVILIAVLLSSISMMRKKPKQILTDLS